MQLRAGQAGRDAVALTERAEAAGALSTLARPRLTGSAGAAQVEQELRGRLEALGYEIREIPCEFSTWPGRWGVPVVGAVLAAATAAAALLLGRGAAAQAALVLAAAGAAVLGMFRSARQAIARLPWGGTRSSNWLVHRPGVRPRYVVMAHRDSKSQPLPTLGRITAGALAAGGGGPKRAPSGPPAAAAGGGASGGATA